MAAEPNRKRSRKNYKCRPNDIAEHVHGDPSGLGELFLGQVLLAVQLPEATTELDT